MPFPETATAVPRAGRGRGAGDGRGDGVGEVGVQAVGVGLQDAQVGEHVEAQEAEAGEEDFRVARGEGLEGVVERPDVAAGADLGDGV